MSRIIEIYYFAVVYALCISIAFVATENLMQLWMSPIAVGWTLTRLA